MRATLVLGATVLAAALAVAPAGAQGPIPEGPDAAGLPRFYGQPAVAQPLAVPDPPRHPFMAPNGNSNLHVDGYQTDVHQVPGPLGREISRSSVFHSADCASVTFDPRGRIVTICVGITRPVLRLKDAKTLQDLATLDLPPRRPGASNIFNDFAGGGYFYLDHEGRAVIPTTERHILTVRVTDAPAFEVVSDVDANQVMVSADDKIISALPDWTGRLWFASVQGVVGTVGADGAVRALPLGEPITNSFAVGDDGGVYVVTDGALYRLDAGPDGTPAVTWREAYPNSGISKPGQGGPGSGTTPTLMGRDLVAITDNADPMNVVAYFRAPRVQGKREVCREPVFTKGASATDNSLIGTRRSLVVENNYGYSGPTATQGGRTTRPGLARVDVDRRARRCRTVWRSLETAPTVVPKLSAATGLVYTYTKNASAEGDDTWYLTALDFRTGRTVYRALAGEGLGFNNNYAPVTLGPDGTAYVGVLGGLVALRDAVPSTARPATGVRRAPVLRVRRLSRGRVRARVSGSGVRSVDFRLGAHRVRRVARAPFVVLLRPRGRAVAARAVMRGGRRVMLAARAPRRRA